MDRDKFVNSNYVRCNDVISVDVQKLRFHTEYYDRYSYERTTNGPSKDAGSSDLPTAIEPESINTVIRSMLDSMTVSIADRVQTDRIAELEAQLAAGNVRNNVEEPCK